MLRAGHGWDELLLTGFVLVLLTLGLAFANGANDVSKSIATLVAVAMSFGSVLGGFRVTETSQDQ